MKLSVSPASYKQRTKDDVPLYVIANNALRTELHISKTWDKKKATQQCKISGDDIALSYVTMH
jgi:hypothetical protein